MIISHLSNSTNTGIIEPYVNVIRHKSVCEKLGISSAKLFHMIANGLFPKPFTIIPGGRAVGWLESDVNRWVFERKDSALPKHTAKQSSVVKRSSWEGDHDNSLVVCLDRTNTTHIVDPDCVPHSDDLSPLQNLVIDIINAGYKGVIMDEKRLKNGRYFYALSTNGNTPEGRLLIQLSSDYANGKPMPPSHDVLAQIKKVYDLKRTSKGGC